jgi:hypothetical protein
MSEDKNRLHFIVKSWLMGQISAIIFLGSVLVLGVINFIQSVIIGTTAYVSSLVILRFYDKQINSVVKKILNILDRHKKIKDFILKHF